MKKHKQNTLHHNTIRIHIDRQIHDMDSGFFIIDNYISDIVYELEEKFYNMFNAEVYSDIDDYICIGIQEFCEYE